MSEVTAHEVADVLERVAAFETRASTPERQPWAALKEGAWALEAEGYRIALFKRDGRFDRVDSAIAPDGRRAEAASWNRQGNPRDLVSAEGRLTLACVVQMLTCVGD